VLRAFVLALLFYNIHKEDISNDSNIPENFPPTSQALFEWLKVNSANSNRELILSFSKLSTEVSKKFLSDQLSVSINIDDIFNTNQSEFLAFNTPLLSNNKLDTRRFGFSINYKIPTKNKLAKETPILLNNDKKEETGIIGN
jgi:hypothetical protein